MTRIILTFCTLCCLLTASIVSATPPQKKIIVGADGNADYRTIQGAINSILPGNTTTVTIYIKKGIYREKIYLEQNNIVLEGEDRDNVIITQSIARDEWRCLHKEDWGVATLNVDADDITLKNLTVINSYGDDNKINRTVSCPSDLAGEKVIRPNSHQMAMRTMNATRLKAINCHFKAYAGDTVSPWNVETGMFYFKDCIMEGGVDFYCPRGWAYADNCSFIALSGDAAIWHDGSANKDSKTVLVNCKFDGYDGYKLGRYHRDAQFFLINCNFSKRMADKPIYLVPTANEIKWGERIYYSGCHRQGGDYAWFKNNLDSINIDSKNIDPSWIFQQRWDPLKN